MMDRIFGLTLFCVVLSGVGALTVNIPEETYEHVRGDNITLPCRFQPSKPLTSNTPEIITWTAKEADHSDNIILTRYSIGVTDVRRGYEGRVSVDVDIPSGRADLKLSSITLEDNKIFECRVLILGDDEGKLSDAARLVVLVPPSKPVCKIQGTAEYQQNINLTCLSEEGSPLPVYRWETRDVWNMPRALNHGTTQKGGILSLYDISKHTSGYYICTSRNKISSASCNITLAVRPPSMRWWSVLNW
ncbi:cell surface A33 antigen-like [Echeneis naucrates]|uniref:cell surface A33 antigen-like n=1 Tax=Echeneis naucrates TaxID=173247 RepID=UPI00111374D5|nr:cell surface A33 antigen-like [Echeneis naucrates]